MSRAISILLIATAIMCLAAGYAAMDQWPNIYIHTHRGF
jgi:hypothetical protein